MRPQKKQEGNGRELVRIVTEKEIAPLLGVHPSTLSNWRNQRCGPPFLRVGKAKRGVRYCIEDVVAWRDGRIVYPEKTFSRLK